MATQITNYQCPACTGPLHFAGDSGRLECDYCGSNFSVAEIEELYKEKEAASVQTAASAAATEAQSAVEAQSEETEAEWSYSGESWGEDALHMKSYNCPSCGAELICDETTAATSCPYCGNPSIVPSQFADMLRPDYVIPFKLDKDAAIEALKKFYRGKPLLPAAFADRNHIEEIKGVYVPFWLFEGEVEADMSFDATRIRTYSRGNERITETDHFRVRRAGTIPFYGIPADGSSKMPDAHMDAIEPYDYSELKPFSTAYLPGFLADKYDISAEECTKRAADRARNTAEMLIRNEVKNYATCVPVGKNIRVRNGCVKYALMPVWMLSTQWNGQNFLFAMNGQTGKLIGDLPTSKGRFMAWFGGMTAVLTALLALLFG